MTRIEEFVGVRVIDLRHVDRRQVAVAAPPPRRLRTDRRLAGGVFAIGLHLAVLVVVTWAPVGQIRTLAGRSPGETMISLAAVDTGVANREEPEEPVLLADLKIELPEMTEPVIEIEAEPEADPVTETSAQEPEKKVETAAAASPASPAVGTSATAAPGSGGVYDPFAGAAPALGVAFMSSPPPPPPPEPELPKPEIDDAAVKALHTELRADAAAPASPNSADGGTVDLLVRVDTAGRVLEAHIMQSTLPPPIATRLLQVIVGKVIFRSLPESREPSWQTVTLTL